VYQVLRLAIAAVMLVLLVLYVRHVDWDKLGGAAANASIALLALSAAGNLPLIGCKAMRLRLLVADKVRTTKLMGFYVASYAADNLVMSQAGLGVRVAALHREGVSIAAAVACQAVEKVLEGVGLALLTVPLLATQEFDPRLATSLHWGLAIGGIALAVLIAVALVWRGKLALLSKLGDVLRMLRDPLLAGKLLLLTMAAWAIEVVIVLTTLRALHVEVPLVVGPTLVLLAVNLAALVPGLPANVGPFEMACVLALGTFGVDADTALGFGIVYHALHTIPVTLVGIPGFFRATRLPALERSERAEPAE
jgi:glycosyltransferase 2 family protein